MKIAVAGGHSRGCPGASHFIDEYTEDRKVVSALIDELKKRGHTVVNCSNEKTTQSAELAEECRLANKSGASLFIAVHFNDASVTSGKRGSECWYYTGSSKGKSYASKVAQNLANTLGLPNRGAKATKSLYVLKNTSMSTILPEVCFVDAKGDTDAYKAKGYKAVAAAIADAIGGKTTTATETAKPSTNTTAQTGSDDIKEVQAWTNKTYGYKQTVDGIDGKNTKKGLIIGYQTELNKQFNKGLDVDGIAGAKTDAAAVNVRKGAKGNLTRILQGRLICLGYSTGGFDGIFGDATYKAVRSFQKKQGLSVDGVAGRNTWAALF